MPSIRTIITMIKNQINPRKSILSAAKEQCHTKCVTSIKQYIRKLHEALPQKWSAITGREGGPGPAPGEPRSHKRFYLWVKAPQKGKQSGVCSGFPVFSCIRTPQSLLKAKGRTSCGLTVSGAYKTESVQDVKRDGQISIHRVPRCGPQKVCVNHELKGCSGLTLEKDF